MRFGHRIKKLSTIVETLHEHLDLERLYLTIYCMSNINGTFIDIKDYGPMPMNLRFRIQYVQGVDYFLEIPDELLKQRTVSRSKAIHMGTAY